MPRDGSNIYSKAAGTTAVAGTTIESAKFNAVVDDIAADLNLPRPIVAGGTGASSASAARTALGLAIGTNVQGYSAALTAVGGVTPAANKIAYFTSGSAAAAADLTAFARTLLDDADAATARSTLGAMKGNSTQVTDWNLAINDGHYWGDAAATNGPSAAQHRGIVIRDNTDNAIVQIVWQHGSDAMSWRRRVGGVFQPWVEAIHTGNLLTLLRSTYPSLPYVSSEQTITSAGLLTLAHGLGAKPSMVYYELKCTTAEYGYSVGDYVQPIDSGFTTPVVNATNVIIRYSGNASVFVIGDKTTGANVNLTNGRWRLIVRAYP